jgi:hypothetical protein
MTEYDKLPKRVRDVIDRCRSGQILQKAFRFKEAGETEVTFTYQPSSKRAPPKSSEAAIASGLLRPNNDGLFDDGTSQTWRAA